MELNLLSASLDIKSMSYRLLAFHFPRDLVNYICALNMPSLEYLIIRKNMFLIDIMRFGILRSMFSGCERRIKHCCSNPDCTSTICRSAELLNSSPLVESYELKPLGFNEADYELLTNQKPYLLLNSILFIKAVSIEIIPAVDIKKMKWLFSGMMIKLF